MENRGAVKIGIVLSKRSALWRSHYSAKSPPRGSPGGLPL